MGRRNGHGGQTNCVRSTVRRRIVYEAERRGYSNTAGLAIPQVLHLQAVVERLDKRHNNEENAV